MRVRAGVLVCVCVHVCIYLIVVHHLRGVFLSVRGVCVYCRRWWHRFVRVRFSTVRQAGSVTVKVPTLLDESIKRGKLSKQKVSSLD